MVAMTGLRVSQQPSDNSTLYIENPKYMASHSILSATEQQGKSGALVLCRLPTSKRHSYLFMYSGCIPCSVPRMSSSARGDPVRPAYTHCNPRRIRTNLGNAEHLAYSFNPTPLLCLPFEFSLTVCSVLRPTTQSMYLICEFPSLPFRSLGQH